MSAASAPSAYRLSWELYKRHTEDFADDLAFYREFTSGHRTLDTFAGYGRISNALIRERTDLEAVELEPEFARFIDLPPERLHVCNVLDYIPQRPFERVIAAYNSFCLLTVDDDIHRFFQNLDQWLVPGGQAALSYYHPDHWHAAVASEFETEQGAVNYVPAFDLSRRRKKIGIWIDHYFTAEQQIGHRYVTRIYESEHDLLPFLQDTRLRMIRTVHDFGLTQVSEPGWMDFILERQ